MCPRPRARLALLVPRRPPSTVHGSSLARRLRVLGPRPRAWLALPLGTGLETAVRRPGSRGDPPRCLAPPRSRRGAGGPRRPGRGCSARRSDACKPWTVQGRTTRSPIFALRGTGCGADPVRCGPRGARIGCIPNLRCAEVMFTARLRWDRSRDGRIVVGSMWWQTRWPRSGGKFRS
jgi:hypothetical protein